MTNYIASLLILLFSTMSYAQNMLEQTRIVNFLGERYGVFYQWSNVDGNLPTPRLATAELEISESLLQKSGQIKSGQYSFFNTVEAATADLNRRTTAISSGKPLYLNELFISESELDYATSKFPGARPRGGSYVYYTESEMNFVRELRTTHQFSGAGLTSDELSQIEHHAQQKLNQKNQYWGASSKAIKDYLKPAAEKILQYRNYPLTPIAMRDDAIVRNVSKLDNRTPGKYSELFDQAWEGRQSIETAKATPVRSQNLTNLKGGLGTAGNMFNFAGVALAIIAPSMNPFAELKGLDCEDLAEKMNRMICKWDDKFSSNNGVKCSVVRKSFDNGHDACGATFDYMEFTIDDANSKSIFKESGLLDADIGENVGSKSIEEYAVQFQKKYKITKFKIGKDFSTGDDRI